MSSHPRESLRAIQDPLESLRLAEVEDDPGTRIASTTLLQSLGYRVLAAEHHGDEIALVLSDLVMPGVGGAQPIASLPAGVAQERVVERLQVERPGQIPPAGE